MSSAEERRIELAREYAQSIDDHYSKALSRAPADDIVVYVVDCDDHAGNALARKFLDDATVDRLIADARQRSGRPIAIADGPFEPARSALEGTLDTAISPPIADAITFVVVADGGVLAGSMRRQELAHDPYPDTATIVASTIKTIRLTYDEAISDGKKDPVVFLLDTMDSVGGNFARRFIPAHVVDAQLAANPPGRPVPVCLAFPHARARELLRDSLAGLQPEDFPAPQAQGICVIAIANKEYWVGVV